MGTRVKVVAGDLVQFDQRKGGMSYESAQDPRLHFGLGKRDTVNLVEIHWPTGTITKLENLPSDQVITVQEGSGLAHRPFPRIPGN